MKPRHETDWFKLIHETLEDKQEQKRVRKFVHTQLVEGETVTTNQIRAMAIAVKIIEILRELESVPEPSVN